jgi:hypothetical protein
VTNGFVQAIIPARDPSPEERLQTCQVLGVDPNKPECVYCGGNATDWDHLRPLVRYKRPTGYWHEYRNLVPACGTCNQSKSGLEWRFWIASNAKNSPRSRGVTDIEQRVLRLEKFECWGSHRPLPLQVLVGEELWSSYWARLEKIESLMFEAQAEAELIRKRLSEALRLID